MLTYQLYTCERGLDIVAVDKSVAANDDQLECHGLINGPTPSRAV
jgi:hypothetical protein